jgi:cell division transport system permease protein
MWLGLKGGFAGGAAAAAVFGLAHVLAARFVASAGADEIEALFGSFTVGWQGYAAIVVAVVLIAAITGVTSRITVHRVLRGQL